MRKGADTSGRSSGHASRGIRHPRRRDAVWLVPGVKSGFDLGAPSHRTSGALALDTGDARAGGQAHFGGCALIVERNPALAKAITSALQARFGHTRTVLYVAEDGAEAPSVARTDSRVIVVVEAAPRGPRTWLGNLAISPSGSSDAQTIFITAETSYELSQRGISGGVVYREPHRLDDIVALVEQALADE